jgi:hypothetical protein
VPGKSDDPILPEDRWRGNLDDSRYQKLVPFTSRTDSRTIVSYRLSIIFLKTAGSGISFSSRNLRMFDDERVSALYVVYK